MEGTAFRQGNSEGRCPEASMCSGRPQRAQESGKGGEQEDWIRQAPGGHLKDVTFVLSKMGNWGIFSEEGDDLTYCFFGRLTLGAVIQTH